jgi:hypothetical protein
LSSDNIIGLVNIRDFALLDTESGKVTVRSLVNFYKHRYGKEIMPDDSCYDVFNKLKKGNEQRLLYFYRRVIF